jgi:hypothetical protein
MIQLIGFLICVYMFVRGLDIWSKVEDRKSRGNRALANIAGGTAIVFAFLFFLLLVLQGNATANFNSSNY